MNSVKYFVIAESVIKGEDESLTIVKIFNSLQTHALPLQPKMVLAFGFIPDKKHDDKDTLKIRLQITDLEDNNIVQFSSVAEFAEDSSEPKPPEGLGQEIVSALDVSGKLSLPRYGVYKAKLFCEEEQIAESRFEVTES